jgi:uncharacterized membrane protein
MTTRVAIVLVVAMTLGVLAYSLAIYPSLGEKVPLNWNIQGQVGLWGNRSWAAFMFPGIMGVMALLVIALPWLSPRNYQVETFRSTFNYVMVVMVALMGYVHLVCLAASRNPELDVSRALVGGICLLLALVGNVLSKVRRNFWMGFRTPWTLANETVWDATHRLGAKLMVAGGILGAIIVFSGIPAPIAFAAACAVVIGFAVAPLFYSLVLYKRLEREGRL